jgi:hypothetical protein
MFAIKKTNKQTNKQNTKNKTVHLQGIFRKSLK